MSNVVPISTKVSPVTRQMSTQADFSLIKKLFNESSLYQIPDMLRLSVVESIAHALQSDKPGVRLAASRLLLEMDRRNIEMLRIVKPQEHIHVNVKEKTTEELKNLVNDWMERHEKSTSRNVDSINS